MLLHQGISVDASLLVQLPLLTPSSWVLVIPLGLVRLYLPVLFYVIVSTFVSQCYCQI
jgi:hypothetical protein